MTDLTMFSGLSLADITAEIEAMQSTFTATRSGQAIFSTPADTAVRGELIEDRI